MKQKWCMLLWSVVSLLLMAMQCTTLTFITSIGNEVVSATKELQEQWRKLYSGQLRTYLKQSKRYSKPRSNTETGLHMQRDNKSKANGISNCHKRHHRRRTDSVANKFQDWFHCATYMIDKCVFLYLITKMSDRVLQQRINIKFCVKLGKLSQKMKHGAFNVNPKSKDKLCDRKSRHPHDPRNLPCRNNKWRQYLLTHSLTHSLHGAGHYLKSW
jgi:hypothetical protein